MSKGVFIMDKEYTFSEAMSLLARAMLSIVNSDAAMFSITDIRCLLRGVNEYLPGEFEIQRAHSHYYQIVYKSEAEVIESFKQRWEGFVK